MSVLTDLRDHLTAQGVTAPIARGDRPDKPDELLTLQTYGGPPGELRDQRGLPADERLAVQVVARAATQAAAETLARQAWSALHFRHETLNGNRYAWCRANQAPYHLGTDERDRHMVAFNLTTRRHGLS